jgi:hypothetical protein
MSLESLRLRGVLAESEALRERSSTEQLDLARRCSLPKLWRPCRKLISRQLLPQ